MNAIIAAENDFLRVLHLRIYTVEFRELVLPDVNFIGVFSEIEARSRRGANDL